MRERTVYNGLQKVPSVKPGNPGSRFRDKMQLCYDPHGGRHLEKVGETDVYSLIQSYAEQVDLQKILERCMQTGDVSVLQRCQGVFTDTTGLPTDSRAAHDLIAHSRFVYEGLSAAQKIKYPTFDDFMEAFATPENIKVLVGDLTPSADPAAVTTESEVTQ